MKDWEVIVASIAPEGEENILPDVVSSRHGEEGGAAEGEAIWTEALEA